MLPVALIEASESTRMVQSVTLHKHGKMEGIKVEDTPIENSIPDSHVEVEVYYCGLSFTDNYLRLGIMRNDIFPVIMGSECCGVVTGVGNGVRDLQVGQRVLCLRMQGGLFRHIVHVPQASCFVVPDAMSLRTAVSLGLNFVVAHLCLFEFGCPKRTNTIFMDSIGGGVGTAVIKLARTVPGVKIFGTASESKHKKLLSLGADRLYRHEDKYVDAVLEAYPKGVDLVINSGGGKHFDQDFRMLTPSGRLITIGTNSSALYPKAAAWGLIRPTWDSKLVRTVEMIKKNHTMVGINVGRLLQTYPKKIQFVLDRIFEMHSYGKITPCVHSIQPFERVVDGLAQLSERENCGKVLLAVDKKTDVWDAPVPASGAAFTLTGYLGRPECKDEKTGLDET
ncbi:synaptic vesicle membrane protein VAT-1 homolog isoform X2 [Schistocerca gregaria]|uniref:synaptic vesicle membrane protein VAT-1 homolog isoform X2 n=1 Tax=Schistocerca gregaria TaxID=7010 RepID=UPI00211E161C|nr:synaptic vesicle membrane protein VAT-1 homolog isoform X2 [Schistocerca gregaria]